MPILTTAALLSPPLFFFPFSPIGRRPDPGAPVFRRRHCRGVCGGFPVREETNPNTNHGNVPYPPDSQEDAQSSIPNYTHPKPTTLAADCRQDPNPTAVSHPAPPVAAVAGVPEPL